MLTKDYKSSPKYKYFLYTNVFHCFCFVYFEDLEIMQTQNRRANDIKRKPYHKVTNSNKNSC